MEEQIQELFTIDEDVLSAKLVDIKKELADEAGRLRESIPDNVSEGEIIEQESFKKVNIINLILSSSEKDTNNEAFNRMLCFLYEGSGGMDYFLSLYDFKIVTDKEDNVIGYDLVLNDMEG